MSSVKRHHIDEYGCSYPLDRGNWVKWEDHEKVLRDIHAVVTGSMNSKDIQIEQLKLKPKEQHANPQKEVSNKEINQDTQEDSTGH